MKKYIYVLLAATLLVSCYKEDEISKTEGVNVELFNFPQGTNSWDKEIEQIYKDHGVKLVYKEFSPAKFNGSWLAIDSQKEFFGEDMTDDQVQFGVKFLKDEVFKYLTPSITKNCFPEYIYMCYDAFRVEGGKKSFPARFYIKNTGYWITCFEGTEKFDGPTRDIIERPITALQRREARGRILQRIFCMAIIKGNIKPPKELMEGGWLDLKTPLLLSVTVKKDIDLTDPTVKNLVIDNPNLGLNRGFPNSARSDVFVETPSYATDLDLFRVQGFGTTTYIAGQTPEKTLWDYINLVMRFDVTELRAGYATPSLTSWTVLPTLVERHPLLYKIRQLVIDYMKKEYNIDLEAIYNGD